MRPVVHDMMLAIWTKQGCLDVGAVFLSKRRNPYADTRHGGGNPLAKAHQTARRKADISGFHVRALRQITGWSSIRMDVQAP
jgi:hypothetical protein